MEPVALLEEVVAALVELATHPDGLREAELPGRDPHEVGAELIHSNLVAWRERDGRLVLSGRGWRAIHNDWPRLAPTLQTNLERLGDAIRDLPVRPGEKVAMSRITAAARVPDDEAPLAWSVLISLSLFAGSEGDPGAGSVELFRESFDPKFWSQRLSSVATTITLRSDAGSRTPREAAAAAATPAISADTVGFTLEQWTTLTRWKLATEAVPLLLGEAPDLRDSSPHQLFDGTTPRCSPWWRRRPEAHSQLLLLQRHIDDGAIQVAFEHDSNVMNPQGFVKARYVKPAEVVAWWAAQGFELSESLREIAERRGWISARVHRGVRADAPLGEKLFGKYDVLEQLTSGGMSEGFRVRDPDGVILFLKRVPLAGIPADALRRELDIYARLERAAATHVLQIYCVESSDDAIALLTEFADGGALSNHLARHPGGLSPADAKPVALAILAGLNELHSLDIVHRDLKPENVFHTGHDADSGGTWKLGDFGISKSLLRLQTQGRTFQGHGTLGFAPPEQMDGAEAHPSADIYAFGKMLAYLLTGQTDVDQIRWPSWGKIARDCTMRGADQRPRLADVEIAIAGLVV